MTSIWDADVYQKAWLFAAQSHDEQVYAGPTKDRCYPYIFHIGAVAAEVIHALASEADKDGNVAVQCALLHDTLEDTDAEYSDIDVTFGQVIADGVKALSKDANINDKRERMLDSLLRIKQQPLEVGMVKLADRICNLSEPPSEWGIEKRRAYRDEAMLILQNLNTCSEVLALRLQQRIVEYSKYLK